MKQDYTSNNMGMHFQLIKAGSFMMGSPEEEIGRSKHENQHRVTLTNDFFLQIDAVSVGQWRKFANETGYKTQVEMGGWTWGHVKTKWHWIIKWMVPVFMPKYEWQQRKDYYWDKPGFFQTEDHPVTCISWNDAQAFIKWLNQKENLKYRLPTEAEWEFTCRAGTQTPFSFGSMMKQKANINFGRYEAFRFLSKKHRTVTTNQFPPNPWGLYNMHGNVWEWCQDCCEWDSSDQSIICETYINDIVDPVQTKGNYRILRGGSWFYRSSYCRSAHRRALLPDISASGIGFRLLHI